jgi:hypothetical protein
MVAWIQLEFLKVGDNSEFLPNEEIIRIIAAEITGVNFASYGTLHSHIYETFLALAVIQPMVFPAAPLGYRRIST